MPGGLWLTGIVSVLGPLAELTIAIIAASVITRRVGSSAVRIAMWLAVGLLATAKVISLGVPPLIAALTTAPLADSSTLEATVVAYAVSGLIAAVLAAGGIVCYAVAADRLTGPVRDSFRSSRPANPGSMRVSPGQPAAGPAGGVDS